MTSTFKSAKQVANELNRIAAAYGVVYDTTLIPSDMRAYAGTVIEWADAMRAEKSYFNYTRKFWIRERGVEDSLERAMYFGGILATVEIHFDKVTRIYTITRKNVK